MLALVQKKRTPLSLVMKLAAIPADLTRKRVFHGPERHASNQRYFGNSNLSHESLEVPVASLSFLSPIVSRLCV
jgi:hypothetical protein